MRTINEAGTNGVNALQSVGGKFVLRGATNLKELTGFQALQRIGNGIDISRNSGGNTNVMLERIDGFAELQEITGDVVIEDNPWLTSANLFTQGPNLNGALRINRNQRLQTVPGLEKITGVLGLENTDNPLLLECPTRVLEEELRSRSADADISISGNLTCGPASVCDQGHCVGSGS